MKSASGPLRSARDELVAVEGGELTVRLTGPPPASAERVALLVHGITASSRSWIQVERRLSEGTASAAIDLRGRGGSSIVDGPYGIRRHAADVAAVCEALGGPPPILVGHSMGAWVVANAAPLLDEPAAVVLVDGGAGLAAPEGLDPDTVLDAVLGPAVARLSETFASRADYLDYWRPHPAFAVPGAWNDVVETYFEYDLEPGPPPHRSRVVEAAVRADGADLLLDDEVRTAASRLTVPTELLRVDLGLMNDENPLVPPEAAESLAEVGVSVTTVPRLNHYSILFAPDGADAVAAAINRVGQQFRSSS